MNVRKRTFAFEKQYEQGKRLYFLGGISQQALAKKIGVTQATVSRWSKEWRKEKENLREVLNRMEKSLLDTVKNDLANLFNDSIQIYLRLIRIALKRLDEIEKIKKIDRQLALMRSIIGIVKDCMLALKATVPEINQELGEELYLKIRELFEEGENCLELN